MNPNEKNISEEALKDVSGGLPTNKEGKSILPSEFKKLVDKDRIHVTSATIGDEPVQVTTETF